MSTDSVLHVKISCLRLSLMQRLDGANPNFIPTPYRLFNVKSTFDENLYTTPLDKTSLSKKQMADAERIAAEIESKSSNNIHIREERNMVSFLMIILPFPGLLGKLCRKILQEISEQFE